MDSLYWLESQGHQSPVDLRGHGTFAIEPEYEVCLHLYHLDNSYCNLIRIMAFGNLCRLRSSIILGL